MKDLLRGVFLWGALFGAIAFARADGMYFAPPGVKMSLPYQRALIAFNGREQAIVIESSVAGAGMESIGWVVPVPSMPEVGVLSSGAVRDAFRWLDRITRPVDHRPAVYTVVLLLFLFAVMNGLHWLVTRKPMSFTTNLGVMAIFGILSAVSLPSYQSMHITNLGRVGEFEAKVIRATDAKELIDWLREGGFAHSDADREAFAGYVRRGWLFVVARVAAQKDSAGGDRRVNRPLIVQFAAQRPVYPLALTALAGNAVQIQLYVFADERFEGDGRFRVEYAGLAEGNDASLLARLLREAEFAGSAKPKAFQGRYVTRLQAILEPAAMKEDLDLRRAASNVPFRSTVWW